MRLQAGQPGPAEAAAREARALAQKVRWDAGLYRLHGLLAEALAARGAHGEAERAFQESLAAMPLIRDHVAAPRRAAFDALPAVRSITSRTGAAANRLPR
jgi:hypothetical protein